MNEYSIDLKRDTTSIVKIAKVVSFFTVYLQ